MMIINKLFSYYKLKIHNKVIHDHVRMSLQLYNHSPNVWGDMAPVVDNEALGFIESPTSKGVIQVLRNAVGGGVSAFPEKSVTKV